MVAINNATVVASAYDTSGNGGRKLVRANNGKLYSITKTSTAIHVHFSSDNGASWLLGGSRTSFTSVQDVALITNGETVYTLEAINNTTIQCYKINTSTFSLTSLGTVDSSQSALGNVSLTINDTGTELHAAWASKNSTYPNQFNIRYAKGTINGDGSVTWGTVKQVSTGNTTGDYWQNPSIVIRGDGNPVILCESKYSGSGAYGIEAWVNTTGTTWVNKQISAPLYIQSNPSAIFVPQSINGLASGRIHVAWNGLDSTDTVQQNIRYAYSDDSGVTWSTPVKLTSGNTNGQVSPSITANKANEIFVVFKGSTVSTSSSDYRIKQIKNTSGTWGAVTQIKAQQAEDPSALYDPTFNFTSPLFVYKDVTGGKVGFYGTWTITTISVAQGSIGTKSDRNNLLTYTITTDGTMGTITEKVNGTTVNTRSLATSGQSLIAGLTQAQWDAVKFGKYANATGGLNTLTVSMGLDTWTYTFDKRLATDADVLSAVKAAQDSQTTFLPSVKAKLGGAIRGKGGTVNDTDSWDLIKAAVDGIPGKKYATGTLTSASTGGTFTQYDGTSLTGISYVAFDFSSLSFIPSKVVFTRTDKTTRSMTTWFYSNYYVNGSLNGNVNFDNADSLYVTRCPYINGVVNIPVYALSTSYTWEAYE
jgi:hypothetical protein